MRTRLVCVLRACVYAFVCDIAIILFVSSTCKLLAWLYLDCMTVLYWFRFYMVILTCSKQNDPNVNTYAFSHADSLTNTHPGNRNAYKWSYTNVKPHPCFPSHAIDLIYLIFSKYKANMSQSKYEFSQIRNLAKVCLIQIRILIWPDRFWIYS